jgi:hypothetical protein
VIYSELKRSVKHTSISTIISKLESLWRPQQKWTHIFKTHILYSN